MDEQTLKKGFRLFKRYLLPNIKKWWKNRQNAQHQQQPAQNQYPQQQQQNQQHAYQQPQQSYAAAAGEPYQQQQQQQTYGYSQQYQQPGYQSAPAGYQQQQQQHGPDYAHKPSHGTYVPPNGNTDMQNASNPHYVGLRNQAIQEGNLMHQAFDAASQAHNAGDGARAKQLSNEGHEHQRKRDQLNDQAADWIFAENNKVQPRGSIDLHGLYVQEAIERVERAVQDAQSQGLPELRVITGKGIHSTNHVAKIKPAIEQLMIKYDLSAHLDPRNSGVLIVNLAGGGGGGSRDLGWVDQADREAGDGQCTIM